MDYGEGGSYSVTMDGPFGNTEGTVKIVEISALAKNWKGAASPYSMTVDVEGVNVSSKVDIQLNIEQMQAFHNQVIAFNTVNTNGVITLYAVGDKPTSDCVFQATLTNVDAGESTTIIGNTVSTTQTQPDYAQTDEKNAGFILNKPDAAIAKAQSTADSAKDIAEAALPRSGGTMTGEIHMGGRRITNLAAPEAGSDAATVDYIKSYADSRQLSAAATLPASGWSDTAPYTQTVAAAGILSTDRPHYGVVYSDNWEAEKEAFGCVDKLETTDGNLTFTCFAEKPEVDLNLQLEVNR